MKKNYKSPLAEILELEIDETICSTISDMQQNQGDPDEGYEGILG